jgi:hypothetical protein
MRHRDRETSGLDGRLSPSRPSRPSGVAVRLAFQFSLVLNSLVLLRGA